MDFDLMAPAMDAAAEPEAAPTAAFAAPEAALPEPASGGPDAAGPVDGSKALQLFGYLANDSAVGEAPAGAPMAAPGGGGMEDIDRFQQSMRDQAEDNSYRNVMSSVETVLQNFTPEQIASLPKETLKQMCDTYDLANLALKAGHGHNSAFTKVAVQYDVRDRLRGRP